MLSFMQTESMDMLRKLAGLAFLSVLAAFSPRTASASVQSDWRPKFYEGLEAVAEVRVDPDGFAKGEPCVVLKHVSGAQKFAAEQRVTSSGEGPMTWTVSAMAVVSGGGEIAAAMEFFDANGRSLGESVGAGAKPSSWTRQTWMFPAPRETATAMVRILSTAGGTVRFAKESVTSVAAEADETIALAVRANPAEASLDWMESGVRTFHSFSDAPLPFTFDVKGDRARYQSLAIEIDIPEQLELADAFTEHPENWRPETPVSAVPFVRDGARYVRCRFERIEVFKFMFPNHAWGRKFGVVIASRNDAPGTFDVYYRVADGERRGPETRVRFVYSPLPKGLAKPRGFSVFSWGSMDRLYSKDAPFLKMIRAFEEAGMNLVNWDISKPRQAELIALLRKRGTGWRFPHCLTDYYDPRAYPQNDEFKSLNPPLVVFDSEKTKLNICPEYFRSNAAFRAFLKKSIREHLLSLKLEKGATVALDGEPWESSHYCVCTNCLEAFRREAGLAVAPQPKEHYAGENKWKWVDFRLKQTEDYERLVCEAIRETDPSLFIVDYDYVVEYGAPDERILYTGCAKSSEMNEKWFDAHQTSYYHILGPKAFRLLRNNTRHLKKPIHPVVAIDGSGGYLSKKEVRSPRQVRQFALAAFVNGCPQMAVYSGLQYDAEFLKAFMYARAAIASVEDFPWGKRDGALAASASDPDFLFATAVLDGREAIALFNYNPKESVTAKVTHPKGGVWRAVNPVSGKVALPQADLGAGVEFEIPAEGVRFLVFDKKGIR